MNNNNINQKGMSHICDKPFQTKKITYNKTNDVGYGFEL